MYRQGNQQQTLMICILYGHGKRNRACMVLQHVSTTAKLLIQSPTRKKNDLTQLNGRDQTITDKNTQHFIRHSIPFPKRLLYAISLQFKPPLYFPPKPISIQHLICLQPTLQHTPKPELNSKTGARLACLHQTAPSGTH